MGEFILDLEKFIIEQRQKLLADKDHLSQSSSPLVSPSCMSQPEPSLYRSHPYLPSHSTRSVDTAVQTELSFGSAFRARSPVLGRPPLVSMPVASSSMRAASRRGEDSQVDHPKYGLPGLGEYEDRQKLIAQEQKRELNKLYNETVLSKNKPRSALDYDELLAQKREEELRYRQFNDVGSYGGKESLSAGYTGRNSGISDDFAFQKVRSAPLTSVGSVPRSEIGDLAGMQLTEGDSSVPYYSQPEPGPSQWPSQYRPSTNALNADVFLADMRRNSLTKTPALSNFATGFLPENDKPRRLPPNPQVGVIPQDKGLSSVEQRRNREFYRKELEFQMQEQKARNKKTVEEEREDIISNATPLAAMAGNVFTNRQFYTGNQRGQLNEKRASYQAELLEQMEADRLRKTQEKDEAQRFDQRSELDTLEYNPWGRGGGGAPLKDSGGNLQTFRRGLNAMNGVNRPGANVYDNSPHTHDGQRKVPEKWHEGHWPLPEEKPPKPKLNYQDELREQIEEKKRRERAEKDEQRREEERLHNRLEEQRRKIQSEFDAEQEKQRRREEEQKRKNKVLIDAQQETKNSKRRPVEKEWWEKEAEKKPQEVEPAPQPMQRMSSSPPLPSIRVQEVMSATPRSISPRRQAPHAEFRSRSRPATVTPPEKDVSEVTVEQVIEKPKSNVAKERLQKANLPDKFNKELDQNQVERDSVSCETNEQIITSQNSVNDVVAKDVNSQPSVNKSSSVKKISTPCNPQNVAPISNDYGSNPDDERPIRPAQCTTTGTQYDVSNPYSPQTVVPEKSTNLPISNNSPKVVTLHSEADHSVSPATGIDTQKKLIPANQLPPSTVSSDIEISKLRQWFPEYVIEERMSEKRKEMVPAPEPEKRLTLCAQEESRPPTSRGRGDVLTQLTAMRRQLQLEQERLQRQMKKDDRYEVYDPRIDDRPRYSAAPSKAKDYEAYNGLDPEEIARKNRERLKQLEEWRKKDFSDPGDRFIDTNSRAGIRDLGGSGGGRGGGGAENDDDVLARFLSNHSSERL